MCGIVGRVGLTTRIDEDLFDGMVDALEARGPDGRGTRYFSDQRVALGHRRLAIVDLSDLGTQPMANEEENVWLTFNGEIYNHPSLRIELEAAGHQYRSNSDSETIIHAYEEWGQDCVRRFRGIFSFAIWDERSQTLYCARDHLGVKPFYYASDGDEFIFASQPRAILKSPNYSPTIDHQGFADYLSYGIVPHDRAAFRGMAKLPPASMLTLKQDGSYSIAKYWTVRYQPEINDFDEAVEQIQSHLESSVSMQLMSDVPVATYLSGGIDSSLISAISTERYSHRMQSLTIGFHERASDERPYARLAADHIGTNHIDQVLTREDAIGLIETFVDAYDEPYALGAAFPLLCIAKLTQSLGIKVILAGDGADELFAGYLHYDQFEQLYSQNHCRHGSAMPSGFKPFMRKLIGKTFDPVSHYFVPREGILRRKQQASLLHPDVLQSVDEDTCWRTRKFFRPDVRAVTAGQLIDIHTYLPDEILTKVDRATMAFGVEARVPFLDPQLVELAFSIVPEVQYRGGERKAAMKAAAAKYLPPSILTARKKGFSIPLVEWLLKDGLRDSMIDEIVGGALFENGLLNPKNFKQKCKDLPANYVWQLYAAERWARRWCCA
jgi:asparagine synthase (glutamine-hydrolysing)